MLRFGQLRVLVLGDMVADEYVLGRPVRISREAPVLILQYTESFVCPGGATNTAQNLRTLGASTRVVGVIGDDEMGRHLRRSLADLSICTDGLIVDPNRPTSTKTRVLAKGTQEVRQQVVRIDRVDDRILDGALRDRMIDAVWGALGEVDALLISDYENGVMSQEVIDACLPRARQARLTVTVDSHGDLFRFKGVTAATPNQPEAESTLRTMIRSDEELESAGRALLEGMEAQGILITRGSQGVALFEQGKPVYRLPIALADESHVVDPTGAGDTVTAVFTLATASGAPMPFAAYLANVAGGEVVCRTGPATLTPQQLAAAARRTHLKYEL